MWRGVTKGAAGPLRAFSTSGRALEGRKVPEPITRDNPRAKRRSLQYQKELEEYQKNPDPEYLVIPKGSIFEQEKVRQMMEEHSNEPPPKATRKGSSEYPYLIKVRSPCRASEGVQYLSLLQREYKFIDRIRVKAISGKGGDGCISFDREPHKPRGPPNGGSGGHGGDVIIVSSPGLCTALTHLLYLLESGD
jgi:hypothetical protein